jgi:hypothetical protein
MWGTFVDRKAASRLAQKARTQIRPAGPWPSAAPANQMAERRGIGEQRVTGESETID